MKKKLLELKITIVRKWDDSASMNEGLYINGKLVAYAATTLEAEKVIEALRTAAGLKIQLKKMKIRTSEFEDFPQNIKSCKKIESMI